MAGRTVLSIDGMGAAELFAHESGGHRWQRIPTTEKRGRVQTSTITVAVFDETMKRGEGRTLILPNDVVETVCRGSGAGGQHRNKVETAVQLRHQPSGIIVRCEAERSQSQNRALAWALLRQKLDAAAQERADRARAADRRAQVGSGERGDKRRTIRTQDDITVDHVTGKRMSTKLYLRGELERLAP